MFDRLLSQKKEGVSSSAERTPNQLMVRRYIESINENALRDIFNEISKKAGKTADELSFIPLANIQIVDDKNLDFQGMYYSNKRISLNAALLAENPVATFHTLIHEELHAVSDNSFEQTDVEKQSKTVTNNQRIGVSRYTSAKTISREFTGSHIIEERYNVANEGITELISDEILSRYLARTGDYDIYGRNEILHENQSNEHAHSYSKYRRAVRLFTTIVATLADIPEDIVKQTIMREYIQSNQILPMEIVNDLEEREPGLSAKIHDILNCDNPEIGWKQLSVDINDSSAFTEVEKNKILSCAIALLDEQLEYLVKQLPPTI